MVDINSIRVLCMEDDPGTARLVQKRLEQAGYQVTVASNGEEGLAVWNEGIFDVITIDQNMPVLDGLGVIRSLATRSNPPPAIMVTGTGNERIAVEALKMGAGDYVVKDVEGGFLELLPSVIESVLERSRVRKEREQALAQLQASEARYRSLFDGVPIGLYRSTASGVIIDANPAMVDMLGYASRERLFEINLSELYVDRVHWRNRRARLAHDRPLRNFVSRLHQADGGRIWVMENARPVLDREGEEIYNEGSLQDITERKQAESRLTFLATHDALTGLPNRMLFDDRLNRAVLDADRNRRHVAVVLLDLDNFKEVNDNLGHAIGDKLLQTFAARLRGCLRQSDTVARLGGDEFILLLPTTQLEDAAIVAQKIQNAVRKPIMVDEHELHITASIGIARYAGNTDERVNLVRNADFAMYLAKRDGGDDYRIFDLAYPNGASSNSTGNGR